MSEELNPLRYDLDISIYGDERQGYGTVYPNDVITFAIIHIIIGRTCAVSSEMAQEKCMSKESFTLEWLREEVDKELEQNPEGTLAKVIRKYNLEKVVQIPGEVGKPKTFTPMLNHSLLNIKPEDVKWEPYTG